MRRTNRRCSGWRETNEPTTLQRGRRSAPGVDEPHPRGARTQGLATRRSGDRRADAAVQSRGPRNRCQGANGRKPAADRESARVQRGRVDRNRTGKGARRMSERCVIYARVSSEGQAENHSLPTQIERCTAHAQAKGWTVVAVEREQHSAADLHGREGLQRALTLIEQGGADVLLSYATDRLSREQMHVGVILDRVLRAGGSLQFVTEDFENSATGKFLLQVRTFAAELEREKIAERTARGRAARTASGKYLPGQKAPYGFRWAPDTDRHGKLLKAQLIEDPETAPFVRRIFRDIAAGGSARMMAIRLNREGVSTPTQRGSYWYPKTISDIVWHPVYVGQAVAWRRHRDGTRAILRDPS